MQNLFQDLRHAIRILIRKPDTTLIAVFTLALVVGSTVAIFGAIDGAFLSKSPNKKADRLMMVRNEFQDQRQEVPDQQWTVISGQWSVFHSKLSSDYATGNSATLFRLKTR